MPAPINAIPLPALCPALSEGEAVSDDFLVVVDFVCIKLVDVVVRLPPDNVISEVTVPVLVDSVSVSVPVMIVLVVSFVSVAVFVVPVVAVTVVVSDVDSFPVVAVVVVVATGGVEDCRFVVVVDSRPVP